MQGLHREKEVPSSRPSDHPQAGHMTNNPMERPETEAPGLVTQARASEKRGDTFVRLSCVVLFLLSQFYVNSADE